MIVADTSALIAVVLGEVEADRCEAVLIREPQVAVSAGTLMELLVVATGRGVGAKVDRLLAGSNLEIVPLTETRARAAAAAYARWGKGVHPAKLNLADCFAYALAQERGAPLLYVGDDFAQTDVASALPGAALAEPPA